MSHEKEKKKKKELWKKKKKTVVIANNMCMYLLSKTNQWHLLAICNYPN